MCVCALKRVSRGEIRERQKSDEMTYDDPHNVLTGLMNLHKISFLFLTVFFTNCQKILDYQRVVKLDNFWIFDVVNRTSRFGLNRSQIQTLECSMTYY